MQICMCLKGLVTPCLGVLSHSLRENGRGVSYIESLPTQVMS